MVSFLLQSDHKLYALNHWLHSLQSLLGFCLSLGSRRRGWCSLWNSSFTSYVSLCEIFVTVAILFSRNEVLAGELGSHKETNTVSAAVWLWPCHPSSPKLLRDSDAGRLWNRRATGLEQEAGDLRWCLFHSMVPLCPQRNSHKWGLDVLTGEAVSSAVLKHREIYGAANKPVTLSWKASSLASLHLHRYHLVTRFERWFPGPQVWVTDMRAIQAFISSFLLPFKASYPSLSPLCIAHPNKSHCG